MSGGGAVLVTGAGGFIGGRVTEVLHGSGREVRPLVRRWASASRIGRLPLDIVQCDILDSAQVESALRGTSAVVHCARGGRDVNVEGTRILLDAALREGVERFVFVSTIAVYGDANGEFSEASPQLGGDEYSDSKIAAEALCLDYQKRGLPTTILRPTLVHGPFSETWTLEPAERLRSGRWLLPEEYCGGPCNLVYVDDVVAAVLAALSRNEAIGEAFNVNGSEIPSWDQYFHALNDAMGLPTLRAQSPAVSRASAAAMMPVRKTAKWLLNHFEAPIMKLYQGSALMKTVMRGGEKLIRETPTTSEFRMYGKQVSYPIEKARRLLGFEPAFGVQDSLALTVAWLRHHAYCD